VRIKKKIKPESHRGRRHMEDLGVDERILLKCSLKLTYLLTYSMEQSPS
jgi:hypothetical protein